MCRFRLLALFFAILPAGAPAAAHASAGAAQHRAAQPHDVWLIISNDGRCLFIEDGHVVRFEGRGEVEFGSDRREAKVAGKVVAYVNGERIKGEHSVRYGDTVELRGGGSRWVIQSVVGGIPAGHGTRIADESPDSEARVETDDDLVFFLQTTHEGGAHFFYPDMNS